MCRFSLFQYQHGPMVTPMEETSSGSGLGHSSEIETGNAGATELATHHHHPDASYVRSSVYLTGVQWSYRESCRAGLEPSDEPTAYDIIVSSTSALCSYRLPVMDLLINYYEQPGNHSIHSFNASSSNQNLSGFVRGVNNSITELSSENNTTRNSHNVKQNLFSANSFTSNISAPHIVHPLPCMKQLMSFHSCRINSMSLSTRMALCVTSSFEDETVRLYVLSFCS